MADQYQSTDKRSEDTRPEVPRLLLEGIVSFDVNDFQVASGGFDAQTSIDITQINDLGNRSKGFDPQTLDVRAWFFTTLTFGGQVDDTYQPMPWFSSGRTATFSIQNVYVIADDLNTSNLVIYFFNTTAIDVSISYKIYSTIFKFDDV